MDSQIEDQCDDIRGVDMSIRLLSADGIDTPRTKPAKPHNEKDADKEKEDAAVDEAEEESFPASDPPAYPDFE
jgi:hypothetical protein